MTKQEYQEKYVDPLSPDEKHYYEVLEKLDIFFGVDENDPADNDEYQFKRFINLNDTFWWGTAFAAHVENKDLEELYGLVWAYGEAGMLYFACKKYKINIEDIEFNAVRRKVLYVHFSIEALNRVNSMSDYAYDNVVFELNTNDGHYPLGIFNDPNEPVKPSEELETKNNGAQVLPKSLLQKIGDWILKCTKC